MKRCLSSSAARSSGRAEPPSSSSSDEHPAMLNRPAKTLRHNAHFSGLPAEIRANVFFTGFPAEFDEPRMTVKGAILVVNSGGKLDVKEYMNLKDHFADNVPKEQHPVPSKPGVKEEEQTQTANLRWWSDAKGEGWIANGPHMGTRTKNKWFNANKFGSWRLAFLLAKLQRDIWLSGEHIQWAIDNA